MKRTLIYVVVTFVLTWGTIIGAGFALGTFETGVNSSTTMIAIVAVSMFFPLVGALVANFAMPPDQRIDLALRPRLRGNVRTYLIAWFAPAAIALAGFVVFFLAFPQLLDPELSYIRNLAASAGAAIDPDTLPAIFAATIASALFLAPFINMIPAFGEEVGWRGMLYPSLRESFSPRAAIIASGIIWGLWHAPVIAMGHNFGMNYRGFPITGIATMTLTCVCFGAFLAWLRERSGSAWPCALAHGAFNAVANIGVAFCAAPGTVLGPSPLGLVAGIPLIPVGIALIVRAGAFRVDRA